MAQHTDPPQFVVPISEDIKNEFLLQQCNRHQTIESPERKDLRVPLQDSPSSSCSAELTHRRQRDISSFKGLEGLKGEETMEPSQPTPRRNSKLFVKRLKSRLEDPKWGYEKLAKEDDDWFLDEEFLGVMYPKMSWLTVLQLASLVLVMMILACTLSAAELKNCKLWDLAVWKWEILVAVVISGHLVSGWGVRIVVFFMEQTFLSNMRVLYFVYGMKKAVQDCI